MIPKFERKCKPKVNEASIINMARGAVVERLDMEMGRVLKNIADLNTPAEKERTVTVKVKLKPDHERMQIHVSYEVDSKLAPKSPVTTSLSAGIDASTGEFYAVENTPNIPGQLALSGKEQESPKVLKVNFG